MNAINWFEIPVLDMRRATQFYERILDCTLAIDDSHPGMTMAMFPYSEPGVGGCLVAFEHSKPHADGTRIYLNGGDDLAAILNRVPAAGGTVIHPKTLIREDIGYFAIFSDSEGNVIGLHSLH